MVFSHVKNPGGIQPRQTRLSPRVERIYHVGPEIKGREMHFLPLYSGTIINDWIRSLGGIREPIPHVIPSHRLSYDARRKGPFQPLFGRPLTPYKHHKPMRLRPGSIQPPYNNPRIFHST